LTALLTERLDALLLVRLGLAVPAHLFFAGVWGYALGSGRARAKVSTKVGMSAKRQMTHTKRSGPRSRVMERTRDLAFTAEPYSASGSATPR
jgi:hypothetical protein